MLEKWKRFKSFCLKAACVSTLSLFCIYFFMNFRLAKVEGNSMDPTILHGQWVLIEKEPLLIETGDIIITCPIPVGGTRGSSILMSRLCKRVMGLSTFTLIIEGDNKEHTWAGHCFVWDVKGKVIRIFDPWFPLIGNSVNNLDLTKGIQNDGYKIDIHAGQ